MKNGRKIAWLVVIAMAFYESGCGDHKNPLAKDVKLSSPNFQTVIESPIRRPVIGGPKALATPNITTTPTGLPITDNTIPSWVGDVGAPSDPSAPIPIPTDDDLFEDGFLGDTPPFDPGLALCGNKHVDLHEQCDDGNQDAGDGCNEICRFEICGNMFVDATEDCDDGTNDSGETEDGDGCSKRCEFEVCGNKRLDILDGKIEECDDGNLMPGDGCSPCCLFERCGNGVLDAIRIVDGERKVFETCDDGNVVDGDGCSSCCQIETCGDSRLGEGEQCDDGNRTSGDGCSATCFFEICGNGILDAAPTGIGTRLAEQCDDRNTTNGDGCSDSCQIESCGNNSRTPNEECDDGNQVNGDGCSALCKLEVPNNGG